VSKNLLEQYIKLMIAEATPLARVPNQLLSPDGKTDKEEQPDQDDDVITDEGNEVNEFSSCGSVAGYTAPLGASPDKLGRRKNKR
jgi:hypothetical protein